MTKPGRHKGTAGNKVDFSQMEAPVATQNALTLRILRHACALAVLIFTFQPLLAGGGVIEGKGQSVENPHGIAGLCDSCHTVSPEGEYSLHFKDISRLCLSCHDGRLAGKEPHPANIRPSAVTAERIPSEFPLEDGKLTCTSCHNVSWGCNVSEANSVQPGDVLRGGTVSRSRDFCFHCHERNSRSAFNVHDQLRDGKIESDICSWCHKGVPSVESRLKEGASYGLRSESFGVCRNCHSMPGNHPNQGLHMLKLPSAEMTWYMSAYELQPRMLLPFERLLEYVRASKRVARSIPLDEKGRITCYTCHNPHEKGVLPDWNPRSLGAEPKKAVNHRLRDREGNVCRACHQK